MASWSGFYGDGQATSGSYNLLSGRSPNRYHLMRIMRKAGMRKYAEVLSTVLEDSTPASTASMTTAEVDAARSLTDNVQGGVRGVTAIEHVDLLLTPTKDSASANTARAITAADVTELQEELIIGDAAAGHGDQIMRAPSDGSGVVSYPTDTSGNGGGGHGESQG